VAVHRVSYNTEGSQNDAHVSWDGQSLSTGPRIAVFATRVQCADFKAPPSVNAAECAILARGGSIDGLVATTLVITHGRGNPERLGNPAEYKLWIVGDPEQSARYMIDITWFFGPDC
jgi:hypothetical protein